METDTTEPLRVMIECPECHAEQEDFDGFGFIFCPSCGYCTHPSASAEDDRTIFYCNVCGECTNA